MSRIFDPNLSKPNQPLRQPLSSPLPGAAAQAVSLNESPAPPQLPLKPASGGSVLQPNAVCLCTYCGQQGKLLCTRCKKTLYCSLECQADDWNAHRHLCRSVESDPAKESPVKNTPTLSTGQEALSRDKAGLADLEVAPQPPLLRIYLKDLTITKVPKGANIQATVVEFYSPSRFYLLSQSPEMVGALQNISELLWQTYSSLPATPYAPCVGEICAVQFSHDQKWYRGLVKALDTQMKVNILYIDFGNEEHVQLDRIKPLTPIFKKFSPCVMECRVAGLVPLANTWMDECCLSVRQLLAGKSFNVTLVDTLEAERVHTVDVLLPSGTQLSKYLLQKNYAVEEAAKRPATEQDISAIMNASLNNFERLSDGKDDNAWAQPPKPLTQAVGDSFNVLVTHMQSPSEMMLQKVENAVMIQELQHKLREHCCSGPSPQNFRPAPGTVCCALFSGDKQWYRAYVLGYPSEERVCVGYLDFGNSEEVDLVHLRPISPALLTLPTQAMRCGLAGVQPAGEAWSADCVLAFQRRISNRRLRIEIQGAHEGKTLVAMTDENSDPQANIAELLTSAGFSTPSPPPPPPVQPSDPEAAAAREPQVSNRHPEPLLWTYTKLPTDGQAVALQPSILRNPHDFYCRLRNPTDHKRLIELGNELKRHCQAAASSPFEPRVGEPCCALCPADGSWYRAMVNEVKADDVAVTCMDYGNSLRLKKTELRPITAALLTLPFQAVHCKLAGVEPLGSEWSSGALLWFQMLQDEPALLARVVSVSGQLHSVKLERNGEDVAAGLISGQLAIIPREALRETLEIPACQVRREEEVLTKKRSPAKAQGSDQSGGQTRETAPGAASPEAHLFPLDWKTGQLKMNEPFPPYIAAAISPSMFFLFNQEQVDPVKLKALMEELAAFCAKGPASVSPAVLSRARPGAACCAQFSVDGKWYRAVILEVGEGEMRVVYADYGNSEKVPFSRIRPIPQHLLQLPFQIVRCSLSGKDQFPAELPEFVLKVFERLLPKSVQATVESYDGSANVLSLITQTDSGRGHLTSAILDALKAQDKSSPSTPRAQEAKQADRKASAPHVLPWATAGTKAMVPTVSPASPQRASQPPQLSRPAPPPAAAAPPPPLVYDGPLLRSIQQMETPPETPTKMSESQTSPCCCQSLKAKIDHLEQLMQLQISLIKQATKPS